ncbi:polymerase [Mesorhizobium sp. WSM3882]|uniref:polymerase n=1 Tax=Mesorhizobium sp. WSM3882 TaxID=2029407 RepID=UPI001FD9D8B6|nr:polymerase [Mesorhizobium sp. WSM3882]
MSLHRQLGFVTITRRDLRSGGCFIAGRKRVQLGEMIANLCAAILLMCLVATVFFLAGKPLWPDQEAKMVILLPPDAMTTASVARPTHPRLPDHVDAGLVEPRPD